MISTFLFWCRSLTFGSSCQQPSGFSEPHGEQNLPTRLSEAKLHATKGSPRSSASGPVARRASELLEHLLAPAGTGATHEPNITVLLLYPLSPLGRLLSEATGDETDIVRMGIATAA